MFKSAYHLGNLYKKTILWTVQKCYARQRSSLLHPSVRLIDIRHRPKIMRALFTSFAASDYEGSKQFYEKAVGLEILREYEGKPHRFTNYDLGGMVLKLYEWKDKYYGSGHSGLFIETDDLDGVVERIRKFGAKTTEIEVHEWGGRCCSVTDPFGNIFDLIDANQKGDA